MTKKPKPFQQNLMGRFWVYKNLMNKTWWTWYNLEAIVQHKTKLSVKLIWSLFEDWLWGLKIYHSMTHSLTHPSALAGSHHVETSAAMLAHFLRWRWSCVLLVRIAVLNFGPEWWYGRAVRTFREVVFRAMLLCWCTIMHYSSIS